MAIKKIYTNGNSELEITWEDRGIWLEIQEEDKESSTLFLIEKNDIQEVIDDLICFQSAIYGEKLSY